MRISKIFKLGVTQHEFDFVDIDPSRDMRLFLDPHFLAHRDDRFSIEASTTIRNFFARFLELVREGDHSRARRLFSYLHEPNETCLGMSIGKPKGNAVGESLADLLFESLKSSKAVSTGLIEHIEDIRLFVRGIDKDKISDMVTNIIRKQLIDYTCNQCRFWGIPLTAHQDTGFYWDRAKGDWVSSYGEALVYKGQKLLLVPKGVVSYSKVYTADRFHRFGVLPFLQHKHLQMNSVLVQKSRSSARVFVTKASIVEAGEAPTDKDFLADFAERHAKQLEKFKKDESKLGVKSVPAEDFDPKNDIRDIAEALIGRLKTIPAGRNDADSFHKCVAGILELLLYPALICPNIETPLHGGRKRIDITFENAADAGFFKRLHANQGLPCPYIAIECKNYSTDPANPEVDQLQTRLSPNRGKIGFLVCREVADLSLLLERCKDAFKDNGSLLIPLMDEDLISMLSKVGATVVPAYEELFTERARVVRMG